MVVVVIVAAEDEGHEVIIIMAIAIEVDLVEEVEDIIRVITTTIMAEEVEDTDHILIIMIKEMIQQVRQQRHHKMENTNLKIIHKKLNIHIHHDLIFLDSIVVHIEVGLEEVIEDVAAVAVSIMD